MPTNIRFIADLADGSTVVGSYVHIVITVPEISRAQVCTLSLLSDTLGRLDINAKHIVRIGTDPSRLTETKQPKDVFYYVTDFLRLAEATPLNFLQPDKIAPPTR